MMSDDNIINIDEIRAEQSQRDLPEGFSNPIRVDEETELVQDIALTNYESINMDYDESDLDSELSTIDEEEEGGESSDTSDDDLWYGNLSAASSDSSLADSYIGEGGESAGFFELMNQHLEIFNHEADSFFRVSLRTLYETLMEFMEEKGGPTPQKIIQSLPTVKVTLAQIASNTTCPICYGEYEQDENLLKLPCNHYYHKDCIINWLKLKSTCPTCRLDLVKDKNCKVNDDENIENLDLTHIDSLLVDNVTEDPVSAVQRTTTNHDIELVDRLSITPPSTSSTSLHPPPTSSSSRLHLQTNYASLQSIASSPMLQQQAQASASTPNISTISNDRTHRIFSRSASPIVIDSSEDMDDTSPFSSKVSVVEAVNSSTLNGGTSTNMNKRQTSVPISSQVPAKRKSRETEIW